MTHTLPRTAKRSWLTGRPGAPRPLFAAFVCLCLAMAACASLSPLTCAVARWVDAACEAQEFGADDVFDGVRCGVAADFAASCDREADLFEPTAALVDCGQATPARATECSRDGVDICGTFSPGDPQGSALPAHRDSTDFNSTRIPGRGSGQELFHDVVSVCPPEGGECRLVTAYNAGFEVRQLDQPTPWQPGPPFRSADGWAGDFAVFAAVGENDFYVDEVAARYLADSRLLLAVSGRQSVGPSLWVVSPQPAELLSQRYQDPTRRVRSIAFYSDPGGGLWVIAIGLTGVHVYDALAAVAAPLCVEPGCAGVYVGEVGSGLLGLHGSVAAHAGEAVVAVASSYSLEVWRYRPSTHTAAQLLGGAGTPAAKAAAVWSADGRLYVAAVEWLAASRWLRIYDLTGCWPAGCASAPPPIFEVDISGPTALDLVTYSAAEDAALVCTGFEALSAAGAGRDRCFEVGGLPGLVAEVGLEGGSYSGACGGGPLVDYWSDLYPANTHGLANFRPRVKRLGSVAGQLVLYQASWGALHAHRVIELPPPAEIFADGFETGDTSRWP